MSRAKVCGARTADGRVCDIKLKAGRCHHHSGDYKSLAGVVKNVTFPAKVTVWVSGFLPPLVSGIRWSRVSSNVFEGTVETREQLDVIAAVKHVTAYELE